MIQCLIATAAFGSALSPQVQFLRNFRDERIMTTTSGSSFMKVFNAWYYSFSPYVADYERDQSWLQEIIRTAICPLLGILEVSEKSYSLIPGEYGSVVAGLVASSLIGMTYFTPIALSIRPVRNKKLYLKAYAFIVVTVTIAVVFSLVIDDNILLMITTSVFVMTVCAISSILCARIIMLWSEKLIPLLKKGSSRL